MENPWEWRDRNPYTATALQVLDLGRTADKAEVRARVPARRKRISYGAERFPLFGRVLNVADINAAEEQLATLAGRLAAELLTHWPEQGSVDAADLAELFELAESDGEAGEPRGNPGRPPGAEREIPLDYRILPRLLPAPAETIPRPPWADEETSE